ncbi:MAG: acyloxyacyl hydrolase [Gammaproteobacteria bacterium]|nr:acyloxyacyl hydrolase [Gammaproteobacteria bacterium]
MLILSKINRSTLIISLALGLFIAPLQASATQLLAIGVGIYNIDGSTDATDFQIEYRSNRSVLKELQPWAGFEINSDSALWAGAGLLFDYPLSEQWRIVPSVGAGLYDPGDSDLDLGSSIEFRSQIEIAYVFANQNRVALALSHLSNARLGEDNPGTEVLSIYWQHSF